MLSKCSRFVSGLSQATVFNSSNDRNSQHEPFPGPLQNSDVDAISFHLVDALSHLKVNIGAT